MIKSLFLFATGCFFMLDTFAQKSQFYDDSLQSFRENYVNTHEVVKTKEDRAMLKFFPIDRSYEVWCRFEKIDSSNWFPMHSSGNTPQLHRKYGRLSFTIRDTVLHLFVYQSQSLLSSKDYKDYLFIPFSDMTSGDASYGGGRYLECYTTDIRNGVLVLDFNKAYNPYCAYSTGYNCPLPPTENDLPITIRAGEKNYAKKTH